MTNVDWRGARRKHGSNQHAWREIGIGMAQEIMWVAETKIVGSTDEVESSMKKAREWSKGSYRVPWKWKVGRGLNMEKGDADKDDNGCRSLGRVSKVHIWACW